MTKLLGFDLESTGLDPYNDRIVEISLQPTWADPLVTYINPGIPIPAEVTAVHGITDEMVKDSPRFVEIAPFVQAMCETATLVGFNCRRFDTLLLAVELKRAGCAGLAKHPDGLLAVEEIDIYQLWYRAEPRTLADAARRFAGIELGDDAHSAEADTKVLSAILAGMIRQFNLPDDVAELARLSVPDGAVDRDGKFKRDGEGVVRFTFGKHRGEPVCEHLDFVNWMLDPARDFSPETKVIARRLMRAASQQLEHATA